MSKYYVFEEYKDEWRQVSIELSSKEEATDFADIQRQYGKTGERFVVMEVVDE